MTDTPIPKWAALAGCELQIELANSKRHLPAVILARALEAADKAATERCLALDQAAYKPAQSRDTNVMMQECAVNDVLAGLEAAIRKGEQ